MRKWHIWVLLLLFVAGLFIPFPFQHSYQTQRTVKLPHRAVSDVLMDTARFAKWFPNAKEKESTFDNLHVALHTVSWSGVHLLIDDPTLATSAKLQYGPTADGQTLMSWSHSYNSKMSLGMRLLKRNSFARIDRSIDAIADSTAAFFNSDRRMYGIEIEPIRFQNPWLITNERLLKDFPTATEVYAIAQPLRDFAAKAGVTILDSMMVNMEVQSNGYRIKTAFPIDRELTGSTPVRFQNLVKGNALKTGVVGGWHAVTTATDGLLAWAKDAGRISPAMPFQMWRTHRLVQPDSTKWTTEIVLPVF